MKLYSQVIVGDGWAGLAAAGFCGTVATEPKSVLWLSGTGASLLSPLPTVESGAPVSILSELVARLAMGPLESQAGSFLREFRNKAFREPAWTKAPTPEARREVRDEMLWAPEARWVPAFESRVGKSLVELQLEIRERVLALENIERKDSLPIEEVTTVDKVIHITLGSGEKIQATQLIYADTLLAKGLPRIRGRVNASALQAVFTHSTALDVSQTEAFMTTLHKESGEEFARSLMGYFFEGGRKSLWTIALQADECEDNHEIGKRLRRMKQALEKMFHGANFLQTGKDFASTISSERVRFEENTLISEGPAQTVAEPGTAIALVTDGFGPSEALIQVASVLGVSIPEASASTDSVGLPAATVQEQGADAASAAETHA